MIEIRLFATLREGRKKVYFFEPEKYATAGEIMTALNLRHAEVAILLINGRHSKPDTSVQAGDIVSLFPPVGGG